MQFFFFFAYYRKASYESTKVTHVTSQVAMLAIAHVPGITLVLHVPKTYVSLKYHSASDLMHDQLHYT